MPSASVFTLLIFGLVGAAIIAAAAIFGYLYWWSIARAQPKLSGERELPGLDGAVEILRDKHGVPHIYATSRADLFRAQGYVHAQDRLWQMEENRRIGRGTLAKLFGEAALEADRFSRTVGFLRAAQSDLEHLDEPTRQVLQWYSEGVNVYIGSRPGRLAPELNLLRVTPRPWTPLDSLVFIKLVAWGQSANWESELTRLRLLGQGSPYRVAELEPDLLQSTPLIAEAGAGPSQQRLVHAAGLLLNYLEPLKQLIGTIQGGQGSNSWVVAPSQSLTRKPILANDPHLPARIPGAWYELHLSAPGYEVAGAGFAGVPGVIIGHNEELAWGITNGSVDQTDLYIERPHPDDATRFEHAEFWEQAEVIDEVIYVRRRTQPHIERVVVTRHGPVITNLLPEAERRRLPVLAARWVGYEPSSLLRAVLKLNAAETLEEANEALADWDVPSQNFVMADVRGNIAYQLAGRVPKRTANLGIAPAPGWLAENEWNGFIAYAELPRLFNPPSGRIVTANNKPVGDEYPYFLGLEFDPGWRAARIEELLGERDRYSVRDMEEIQLDTQSKYAAELVRWIVLLSSEDPWEKVSIQALRKWNFRMEPDSLAALVFHYVLIELLTMVFGDKLGPMKDAYFGASITPISPFTSHIDRAQQKLLELLESDDSSAWYSDAATGRRRDRDQLLQEALTSAIKRIRELLGDSMLKWQWGRSHQVSYVHPLGSVRLIGNLFNRGPIPVGGDNSTIMLTRHTPKFPLGMVQVIPSYRQIIEVGAWDRMQSVTPTGQSGHPFSPNYDDQMAMWREGVYHILPWRREAVDKIAMFRLLLKPSMV